LIIGDTNGFIRIINLVNIIEKHSNYNNNFNIESGQMTFYTEVDQLKSEELIIRESDVVEIALYRAH